MVDKICTAKKQDHLGTHKAIHRLTGKPVATSWITEFFDKVKKLIEKFEKHQRKEYFFKDLSQSQKINKFSKESKDLLADIKTQKSSNFAKILPNSNVLSAIPTGKSVSSIAVVEEM